MYCPKCGAEAMQTQRFCKLCGTNLQLIHDTLKGDGPQSPFGIDVEKLTQNALEFAKSWKSGLHGQWNEQWNAHTNPVEARHSARDLRRQAREEARLQNLPKPKDYLSYSWQHNLRDGLISLFTGVGLGILLYYLAQEAISSDFVKDIPNLTDRQRAAIDRGLMWVWLAGVIPALKGLAQIVYAAFFGESIATLTERFTPARAQASPYQDSEQPARDHVTSPSIQREQAQRSFEELSEPPSSVTERTTHIFDST
ncbi:MAG TPA: zinc ribbon domain-containing protein, partial [Blastocatellia bacterium]|nr:zinc ribbon domain-containing protein [Blastocatellia bacterium]